MKVCKMTLVFKGVIFRCHVNFGVRTLPKTSTANLPLKKWCLEDGFHFLLGDWPGFLMSDFYWQHLSEQLLWRENPPTFLANIVNIQYTIKFWGGFSSQRFIRKVDPAGV